MSVSDGPDRPMLPRILSLRRHGANHVPSKAAQKGRGYSSKDQKDQPVVPTTRRPFDELLTAMRKGADMMKHGRQGKPKMHYFRLGESDNELTWRSAKGVIRSVALWTVTQVLPGQTTDSFKRYPNKSFVHLSFSLIYGGQDGSSPRTLDLTASDRNAYELWYCGLQALAERLNPEFTGPSISRELSVQSGLRSISPQSGAMGMPMGGIESPGMAVKAPILSGSKPLPPISTYAKQAVSGVGGGTAQGRVAGAMGLPVVQEQPGDCYRWGTNWCEQNFSGIGRRSAVSLAPQPILGINHLDVLEVAVGLGHAAMLTRNGEMYTWGEGRHGKLGSGHQQNAEVPEKLHTLWGQIIRHICASESVTAALNTEGQVLMAGEFCGGDSAYHQSIPRPVLGPLADRVVVQVSCGTFHAAAATSNGALFTWGDGLCGKLGHGDTQSCSEPRQVEGLRDNRVSRVACSAWHTAAIASPLPDGADSLEGLSFIERIAVQHKLAAMYELTQEDGGSLYTWGGVACAVATGNGETVNPASMPEKQHKGFLGHGDTQGRLVPTLVGGALEGVQVRSVAVGLTFTVVATLDGRVFQMGTTTANGKSVPWEGCTSPCQILGRLSGHYVDSVSAGRYHVAALAGPLNQSMGKAHEGLEHTMIFVWGKGEEGQLGLGNCNDATMPQLVEELNGRRIVQVACGGDQTMVVCLHDPGADDTEERRRGYKQKMKQWFSQPQRLTVEIPPRDSATDGPSSSSLSGRNNVNSGQHFSPDARQGFKRAGSGLGNVMIPRPMNAARRRESIRHEQNYAAEPGGSYGKGRQIVEELIVSDSSPQRVSVDEDSEFSSRDVNSITPRQQAALQKSLKDIQVKPEPPEPSSQTQSREEYVKSLEAKLEHLQGVLKGQSNSAAQASSPNISTAVESRPTIVDISAPALDLRGLSPAVGSTSKRATLMGTKRSSQSVLPTARPSAFASAAQSTALEQESQDLVRQKMALLAQLETLEQKQRALATQISQENSEIDIFATDPIAHQLPRVAIRPSDRQSAVSFSDLGNDQSGAAKRPPNRYRTHRRSKSGSALSFRHSPPLIEDTQEDRAIAEEVPIEPTAQEGKPERLEIERGVYLKIKDSKDGRPNAKSVTFSKSLFTPEQAEEWYQRNKTMLVKKYQIQASTMRSTRSRAFSIRTMAAGSDIGTKTSGDSTMLDTFDSRALSIASTAALKDQLRQPQYSGRIAVPSQSSLDAPERLAGDQNGALTDTCGVSERIPSPGTYSRAWFSPASPILGSPAKTAVGSPEPEFLTPRTEFSPREDNVRLGADEDLNQAPSPGRALWRDQSLAAHPVDVSPTTTEASASSRYFGRNEQSSSIELSPTSRSPLRRSPIANGRADGQPSMRSFKFEGRNVSSSNRGIETERSAHVSVAANLGASESVMYEEEVPPSILVSSVSKLPPLQTSTEA